MSLITSLNRLERVGDANSEANKKLLAAAADVAAEILRIATPTLLEDHRDEGGRILLLGKYSAWQYRDDWFLLLMSGGNGLIVGEHLGASRQFAADVAAGLLDQVATWVEARTTEVADAAAALESAQ